MSNRKRDGEQKREIKMVMKQYDLDLVKRQSRTISRLAKLALREESASKRANDDSDTIVVKQDSLNVQVLMLKLKPEASNLSIPTDQSK
jgi:hypothetical protein